jgi:hypothetical protein
MDRFDPGPCIICGAEFCACTSNPATEVVALPARDAAATAVGSAEVPVSDEVFTTATYRGRNRDGRLKKVKV